MTPEQRKALEGALPWKDGSTAPEDGTVILVGVSYRFTAYKPDGARQMKSPGRWQCMGEFGWENCSKPERWLDYAALSEPEGDDVERVAKALCAQDYGDWDAPSSLHTPKGQEPDDMRSGYRAAARAAISAMPGREAVPPPSEEELAKRDSVTATMLDHLLAFERENGPVSDDFAFGRIPENKDLPSFRITAGHIRAFAAMKKARG